MAVCVGAFVAGACNWLSLARNSLTYETTQRGEAANVVARDSVAYATLAASGFAVIDARTGRTLTTVPPPAGSESVDDLAIAGELLFALDGRVPGHLSVFSLREPSRPALVSSPRDVPVGPFSGVSAAGDLCIVSGGTSSMTAWRFDSTGALDGPISSTDLGRGQPDVLLSRRGSTAFVSTHYWGPYFGIDVVRQEAGRTMVKLAELELDGAGFTAGGAKPANFPIEAAELDESRLLVAFARGVAVIDVSQPTAPRLDRVIDVGGPAVNVDAAQSTAAVAVTGPAPGVVVIDFSAAEPRIVRRVTLPPGTIPIAVAFSERNVIVAARGQGILVLER